MKRNNTNARTAFTLIELLVVITIIVVLLALLAPALDQAIYQADLALCGSKLHAIATGAIVYTSSNKRFYPDRPARRSNGSNRPIDLYFGLNQLHHLDDRLILRQFLSVNKTLNCPLLSKPIDIEGSNINGFCASTYGLYFGWGYAPARDGDKEMRKVGDRWTYLDGGSVSFNVLASDWDGIYTNNDQNIATHPDTAGQMAPYHRQDQDGAGWIGTATFSAWAAVQRPAIDENFAFDDGSVMRITGVKWNEGVLSLGGAEDRLLSVQQSDSQNQPTWFFRVPGNR